MRRTPPGSDTVVVNATAIGGRPDGISAYGVHLLRGLARVPTHLRFLVYANADARLRLCGEQWPANVRFSWVGRALSPEHGSTGHLLRWIFANAIAARHRGQLVFALSQIEAPLAGGPRIVTVHDLIPLLFKAHHPRQYHYYRHVLGRALHGATAIVVPSRATRDRLLTHYRVMGDRIRVIEHGLTVPDGHARRSGNREDPFIFCLGRANPVKNVDGMLRAYALIRSQVAERLVIAGVDVERARSFTSRDERLALGDRIEVRPNVSEEEKLSLMDRASVFVHPSLDEGFGLPPLEAMARGCPVIAARSGSVPEVCGDAAVYVDPGDPGGMALAIRHVLSNDGLRHLLSARGVARARAYRWERSARAHLTLFETVLGALASHPVWSPVSAGEHSF